MVETAAEGIKLYSKGKDTLRVGWELKAEGCCPERACSQGGPLSIQET